MNWSVNERIFKREENFGFNFFSEAKFVGNSLSWIFFFFLLEFLKDHQVEEILDGFEGDNLK